MKPRRPAKGSQPRYEPPVLFARIWELAGALGEHALGGEKATSEEILEASIMLGDIAMTFGGHRRRRARPVSQTRKLAALAIQVAKRFNVKDAAAASAADPTATPSQRATIMRTMTKLRSGEVTADVVFLDAAVDRAGARLGAHTGNK